MSNMIKEIGKLCLRRDPNLPRRLTDSQRASTHQHPDIISAEQAIVGLQKKVSLVHSICRQAADSPKGIEYKRLRSQIRAMKLREERAALKEALRHYHSTADLDHMVAQLKGEEPSSRLLAPVEHAIADRNWLAANLFLPVTDESFADIVETMSRLCSQSEGKGQRSFSDPKHDVNSLTHGSKPCDSPSKPILESDAMSYQPDRRSKRQGLSDAIDPPGSPKSPSHAQPRKRRSGSPLARVSSALGIRSVRGLSDFQPPPAYATIIAWFTFSIR